MTAIPIVGNRPAEFVLEFLIGDDYPALWTWRDKQTNTPIDLTGYGGVLAFMDKPHTTTLLSLSTLNGRLLLGGAAGTIAWSLTAEEVAALPDAGAWYLRLTAPSGTRTTKAAGPFTRKSAE